MRLLGKVNLIFCCFVCIFPIQLEYMKNLKPLITTASIAVLTGVVLLATPFPVSAGDMIIEEGSVFSETFVKDGRRVEVTKTYTRDGVVIHQKIYDEQSGALIREKTTTNPIKDHVKLIAPGATNNIEEANTLPAVNSSTPVPDPAAPGLEKAAPAPAIPVREETEEEVEARVMEEYTGPEAVVERARIRYGLTSINRIFVGQDNNRSEIAVEAVRTKRFLGLFNVDTPVNMVIDGESGEIVSESKTIRVRLLEIFSF